MVQITHSKAGKRKQRNKKTQRQHNQYEIGHLNSPVAVKEIDFVILKLPPKKEIPRSLWLYGRTLSININFIQSLPENRSEHPN